jgi:O-antigen/teichoic acid export membrane protein
MKPSSLKINFVWAFFGNAISAFCQWLMLVILTKSASVETVGLFGLAQAVALPVSMLFSLKLQLANVTDVRRDYEVGHYTAIKCVTFLATVVVIGLIGIVCYPGNTALVLFVLGIGYAINEFREYFLSIMQKYERMDYMSVARISQGVLSLVLFGAIFLVSRNLVLSIFGMIAARLLLLVFYDIPVASRIASSHDPAFDGFWPKWEWTPLWRLVRLTAPLGLVGWMATLFTSIPRIVMDGISGRESVGYFSAISSLLVVGTMITAAMSQTASPRMATYFIENKKAFVLLFLKLLGVSVAIGALAVVMVAFFGRPILVLLFTEEYAQHNPVFLLITVAGCILFMFYAVNTAQTSMRQFTVQLPIYAIAVAACFISSKLLIPRYDMLGAAWSLIVCYAVVTAGSLAFSIRGFIRASRMDRRQSMAVS